MPWRSKRARTLSNSHGDHSKSYHTLQRSRKSLAEYENMTSPIEGGWKKQGHSDARCRCWNWSLRDEQTLLRSTFYCPFCRCDEEAGHQIAISSSPASTVSASMFDFNTSSTCGLTRDLFVHIKIAWRLWNARRIFLRHTTHEHGLCVWYMSPFSHGVYTGKEMSCSLGNCFILILDCLTHDFLSSMMHIKWPTWIHAELYCCTAPWWRSQ